jgi:branched-subunit amino acid aminotransferase/4-amino-4-deoxychorismate lyase
MIWVDGQIVPDDALKVSALDRTFEHGLGLFETLRTWDRRAPLLGRHLARMEHSAQTLGLPFSSVKRPDDRAVEKLLKAERVEGDVMLRITLSGGISTETGATLWMRTAPLPSPIRGNGAVVEVGLWRLTPVDPLAKHKTLNFWPRRRAYELARDVGYDEILSVTTGGKLLEGSRTNVFLVQQDALVTPSLLNPIVPGIMRGLVIELARGIGLNVTEDDAVRVEDVFNASEVFLTNSVRGVIPVARVQQHHRHGRNPWTQRLSILVNDWVRFAEDPT